MTADELLDRSNLHGVDLQRCLLRPPRMETLYFPALDGEGMNDELWLVLIEDPNEVAGYSIFYDQRDRVFGLAYREHGSQPWVVVGQYGTFLETLEGM